MKIKNFHISNREFLFVQFKETRSFFWLTISYLEYSLNPIVNLKLKTINIYMEYKRRYPNIVLVSYVFLNNRIADSCLYNLTLYGEKGKFFKDSSCFPEY